MTLVGRTLQSALALLLTGTVGVGPAFAPEHLHERDEDHPTATIHRHLAPHGDDHAQSERSRFDHGDDHVVWLTAACVETAVYNVSHLLVALAPAPTILAPTDRWTAVVLDYVAPPHGPPRRSPLGRAPPHSA